MARYADITPFYEWLDWLEKESNSRCPEYNTMMFYEIRDKLDDLPEVVYCEDCKYRVLDTVNGEDWCNHTLGLCSEVYATDFCCHGERKDNG